MDILSSSSSSYCISQHQTVMPIQNIANNNNTNEIQHIEFYKLLQTITYTNYYKT